MGIYVIYNKSSQKWEVKGYNFIWEFNTEEEAKSRMEDAWKTHIRKLTMGQIIHNILVEYRY